MKPNFIWLVLSLASLMTIGACQSAAILLRESSYFEEVDPIFESFVNARDEYNLVALRVDRLAGSVNDPIESRALYAELVGAAIKRHRIVESNVNRLYAIEPPSSLENFHVLEIEHSEYTLQFLTEIQVAYDISTDSRQRDAAYEKAMRYNRQVNTIQDRMMAELEELGYENR